MSVSNPLTFPKSASSYSVRIRWFVENCCEIRLSNGKTIVIDPCLPEPGEKMDQMGFGCGYTVDDLEACDYVLINHVHGDHVWSIKKVIDRFDPKILVNGFSALQLAKVYEIENIFKIFPLQYDNEYDFGDFRLKTYRAQHIDITPMGLKPPFPGWDDEALLGKMGSLFNMNYLIIGPNNFRIAFDGGFYDKYLNDWHEAAPNLLIRHIDNPLMHGYDGAIRNMADSLERSGAQYMLLNCVQSAYRDDTGKDPKASLYVDLYDYTSRINRLLEERGSVSRVFNFKMGHWYTLSLGIEGDPEA